MTARHALIRRLPAVETLGSVTVLGNGKTGTLTEGIMVARRLWTPSGEAENGYSWPRPPGTPPYGSTASCSAAGLPRTGPSDHDH